MPYNSVSAPGQRRSTSAFRAGLNGALVQNFCRKDDRSWRSNSGCASSRWYCTGTSMVCVTRCCCASARYWPASNLDIRIAVPPRPMVGKKLARVVLEYSGVDSSVTACVP